MRASLNTMRFDDELTPENWRTWPHLKRGVLEVRRLVPWREIAAVARPSPLPVAPLSFNDLAIEHDGQRLVWSAFEAQTHVDGLAIVHGGRLVHETYRGGLAPDQPHLAFSVAKSIVGLLAELLIDEGLLDETAPAETHVPELRGSAFGRSRLRDLLDMVDGAPFDETYSDLQSQIHTYSRSYWGTGPGGQGVLSALAGLPRGVETPGRFLYRTPVADVVGWIVRRAAGRQLSDLISEKIWRPIGAEHPAYLLLDRSGDEIGGTGFGATLRDLARLGRVLADLGRLEGETVFPEAVVRKIMDGGSPEALAAGGQVTRPGWSYRSLWWATGDPHGSFGALGVFGQRLYISPGRRFVVVRFGSNPTASNSETDGLHMAAFEAAYRHVAGEGRAAT